MKIANAPARAAYKSAVSQGKKDAKAQKAYEKSL